MTNWLCRWWWAIADEIWARRWAKRMKREHGDAAPEMALKAVGDQAEQARVEFAAAGNVELAKLASTVSDATDQLSAALRDKQADGDAPCQS